MSGNRQNSSSNFVRGKGLRILLLLCFCAFLAWMLGINSLSTLQISLAVANSEHYSQHSLLTLRLVTDLSGSSVTVLPPCYSATAIQTETPVQGETDATPSGDVKPFAEPDYPDLLPSTVTPDTEDENRDSGASAGSGNRSETPSSGDNQEKVEDTSAGEEVDTADSELQMLIITPPVLEGIIFSGEFITTVFSVSLGDLPEGTSTLHYYIEMQDGSLTAFPEISMEKEPSEEDTEPEVTVEDMANGIVARGELLDASDIADAWLLHFTAPDEPGEYEFNIVIVEEEVF